MIDKRNFLILEIFSPLFYNSLSHVYRFNKCKGVGELGYGIGQNAF